MDPHPDLPEPLRGNETGTFTHHSVAVRLPEIAGRVPEENDLDPAQVTAVERLIDDITDGTITQLAGPGPDTTAWDAYTAPYEGTSWLDVPWFFAEYYFYRRLLGAVEYWETGADPFAKQKQLGLEQAIAPARQTIAAIDASYAQWVSTDVLLIQLMDAALWGNQIDLSLWPTSDAAPTTPELDADRLLVDDRPRAIATLGERVPPPIDLILDNAGSELVADMLLADMLLRGDLAARIRLHAKQYPIFVSDATPADVTAAIDRMAADDHRHLRSAGERLHAEIGAGRLAISSHPYWVSPLGWRQRPDDLDRILADSGMLIVKGDANYRRLVDDRHWEFTTPFATALGSSPAPLLALRTLKSEVAAGLDESTIATVAAEDPDWLQNGRWAMAAFSEGGPPQSS